MKKIYAFILFMTILHFSCEKNDDDRVKDLNYNPVIIPENFHNEVTNTYFPLVPGKVYTYMSQTSEGTETVVVTVLTDTRTVAGVSCTIVRDMVELDGVIAEDTFDWFAQDVDGNVWYFGEDVSNYENGTLSDKEGSFEAGVDGAKPGIIMMASTVIEMPYRQEYHFNVAEDWGKVVARGLTVTVSYGTFTECIKTADCNALEPDEPIEYKYYAPGIGMIKEEVAGTNEVLELISVN